MYGAFNGMLQVADAELVAGVNSKRTREAHWTFLNTFRSLGIDEAACMNIRQRLTEAHQERHLWCEPDAEAAGVLPGLQSAGLRIAAISNTEDGRANESLALANQNRGQALRFLRFWVHQAIVFR